MGAKVLAWDSETSHLRWYLKDSKMGCITISVDGETGYYIPADFIFKSRLNRKLFCEMCYSCNTMVGANIKFDLHYLMKHLPEFDLNKVKHIDDVGQLSHAINSDRTKGLKPLTFFYTPFGGYDDELDVYKKQLKITNYLKIPHPILSKYATIDAIVTYRIFFALTKHMQWIDEHFPNEKPIDWNISKWYNDFMVPAYTKFVKMEHTGMCIDYDYLLSVRQRLLKRIPEITKKLADIWGVPTTFKFGSTLELGKQIEKMGWPCVERSAAGNYATSDACIQEWKRQNQPGIKELIQLRELNSFLGTFIGMPSDTGNQEDATGWEQFVTYHPEDNSYRIHQSYLIMGTETMRCIGKDPNLQNVPVHSKLASEINRCITVPTAPHYRIEFDSGEVVEGGELDTIKVIRDNKEVLVHLNEVTEDDDYVFGSFVKYKNDREDCFPNETGKDFDDLMNKLYDYVPADHEQFYPKN
jgi:DNA polymerase I-like protein with 3'-5' exonuclease and polymerase domains